MKIGFDRVFWVVLCNPSDRAWMADVMFETDLNGLQRIMVGMQPVRPSDEEWVVFDNKAEALEAAEDVLAEVRKRLQGDRGQS